jgi:hypothetical protein
LRILAIESRWLKGRNPPLARAANEVDIRRPYGTKGRMGGHFIRGAILKIPRFSAGIASWGMVDLCTAHTDGLDGFASE